MAVSVSPATEADHSAILRDDDRLDEFRIALRGYRSRVTPLADDVRARLGDVKRASVVTGDEAFAKAAWCLETIGNAQDEYLRAWQMMREDRYYGAWCALEQAELALHFLARHFDDSRGEYGIAYLHEQIPRWQALFPYRLFTSTGLIGHDIHCSVCDARLTPRTRCAHRVGEIYAGEMAARVIKRLTLVEMSLVENPVHKYAVPFITGQSYNYAQVHYVASGLLSPWHSWDTQLGVRRRADTRFVGVGRNDSCPCGSGKKFKRCHVDQVYYDSPHVDVIFRDGVSPHVEREQINVVRHGVDDGAS